ncbi:MAG: DUF1294 domain-containing protein [Candidatus Kerfeldbacteria bacterium]|nr:DUF1294 domain-containing protein [Candidatus Kerfeldbacteria bacterium]
MPPQIIVGYYLLGVNLLTCVLFGVDKYMAAARTWRISEKTLWFFSCIGGSAGAFIGMHLFRHKTKKLEFQFVMLCIVCAQLFVAYLLYQYVF